MSEKESYFDDAGIEVRKEFPYECNQQNIGSAEPRIEKVGKKFQNQRKSLLTLYT